MSVAVGAVGVSLPRVDATAKLRGEAEFVGDLELPGMLHGKILRSPVPHARVRMIDTAAAEALPGVVCVLTAADVRDLDPFWGHRIRDRPLLAIEKVRFAGDTVAAVAAEDEAIAEAALELIQVDYEDLPAAATLDAALAFDAPLVHEDPVRPGFGFIDSDGNTASNVCYRFHAERGEVEAVFARAEHVVEGVYEFPALYQYAMETHTVLARADAGRVELWSSCQHPFLVRQELALLFGLPVESVRVHVPFVGGGFGSKSYTKLEPIAVALARKAGRPVRIRNRVEEAMVTTRRHGMRCRMRTAMNREGRLLARELECWFDTGAYADNGPRVAAVGGEVGIGPYRWEAHRATSNCVYTNTAPAGSYRAFGAVHVQWAGEAQVDELARLAGLDPVQVRLQNLARPGDQVKADAGKPLDADLIGDLERLAGAIEWSTPRPAHRGRGVSVGLIPGGAQPDSNALVRRERDGRFTVLVGTQEIGQGARTAMAQIAAHELGVPAERVVVMSTDTAETPFDRSTGASRSTTTAGLAVQRAAAEVRTRLAAGEDGEVVGIGSVSADDFPDGSPLFWEVCMAAAEVELDPETGFVRVSRLVTVADVGRAINPQLIACQDEGAALQGIGNAFFERMIYDDEGYLLNSNLLEYRIPTAEDLPDELQCLLIENGDGPGPFGAKGCGEGAFAAVPSAIVNALAEAGVPGLRELPLTPERVWRRLRELDVA